MKGLETGKDKVKKICDALRKETLEPAKKEADEIIESAKFQAHEIIRDAKESVERMLAQAKLELDRRTAVFQTALNQACRQTLEALKQQVEKQLFNPQLGSLITAKMQQPDVLAQLITAVVKAIEKDGIEAEISAFIPSSVPARAVNALLGQQVLDRLKEKSVLLSSIGGGVEVKLRESNITIDLSDAALKEFVAQYIRKDFREVIFSSL
jgi:V/A-type H+/Na+-transporting ATPase subunit E